MLRLKIGDYINISEGKTGMGAKGPWLFAVAKADKGRDQITVWADNADEAKNWEAAKIKEISSVSVGHKQVNNNWYTTFSVNAILEKADAIEAGFVPDLMADVNLPFN